MESIRNKIQKIVLHNEKLKKFNYKMESFLVSFDTYSVPKVEDKKISQPKVVKTSEIQKLSKILKKEQIMNQNINQQSNQNDININYVHKRHKTDVVDTSYNMIDTSLLFDTKNDILNRALNDSTLNKSNKGHLIKIIDLLYQNKDGIIWEDLIKKSGVPKYRCIEILNCLVKTDPPILIKKRDKGFTCYLNDN